MVPLPRTTPHTTRIIGLTGLLACIGLIILLTGAASADDTVVDQKLLFDDSHEFPTGDVFSGGDGTTESIYDDMDIESLSISLLPGVGESDSNMLHVEVGLTSLPNKDTVQVGGDANTPTASAPIAVYSIVTGNDTKGIWVNFIVNFASGSEVIYYEWTPGSVPEIGPGGIPTLDWSYLHLPGDDAYNSSEVGMAWIDGTDMKASINTSYLGTTDWYVVATSILLNTSDTEVLANDSARIKGTGSLATLQPTEADEGTGDVMVHRQEFLDFQSVLVQETNETYRFRFTMMDVPTLAKVYATGGDNNPSGLGALVSYLFFIGNDSSMMRVFMSPNLGAGGFVFTSNYSFSTDSGQIHNPASGVLHNQTEVGRGWLNGTELYIELQRDSFGHGNMSILGVSSIIVNLSKYVAGDSIEFPDVSFPRDDTDDTTIPDGNGSTDDPVDDDTPDDDDDDTDDDGLPAAPFLLTIIVPVIVALRPGKDRD